MFYKSSAQEVNEVLAADCSCLPSWSFNPRMYWDCYSLTCEPPEVTHKHFRDTANGLSNGQVWNHDRDRGSVITGNFGGQVVVNRKRGKQLMNYHSA